MVTDESAAVEDVDGGAAGEGRVGRDLAGEFVNTRTAVTSKLQNREGLGYYRAPKPTFLYLWLCALPFGRHC